MLRGRESGAEQSTQRSCNTVKAPVMKPQEISGHTHTDAPHFKGSPASQCRPSEMRPRAPMLTLSVNHATVKNSGHRTGLLVIQLQGDSLQGGHRTASVICSSEQTCRTTGGRGGSADKGRRGCSRRSSSGRLRTCCMRSGAGDQEHVLSWPGGSGGQREQWARIGQGITMGSSVTFSNCMSRTFRTSWPLAWAGLPGAAQPLVYMSSVMAFA